MGNFAVTEKFLRKGYKGFREVLIIIADCEHPHPPPHTYVHTRTILPSRLGAWQFLADMPYGSISLKTAWMIFWNIYCKDQGSGMTVTTTTTTGAAASATEEGGEEEGGQRARVMSPSTPEEIQDAIRGTCTLKDCLHTSQISQLPLYPSLWLLIPGFFCTSQQYL